MRGDLRPLALAAVLLLQPACSAARSKIEVHPSVPLPVTELTGIAFLPAHFLILPFCGATATMIATATMRRELKLSEAWQIVGNCVAPVVGGLLVKKLFQLHPEWNTLPTKVWRYDPGIGSQS